MYNTNWNKYRGEDTIFADFHNIDVASILQKVALSTQYSLLSIIIFDYLHFEKLILVFQNPLQEFPPTERN